jgi:hypothetical protein
MPDRESIDRYFGHPGFEGSAHPDAKSPEEEQRVPIHEERRPWQPAPLLPRDGVPHCATCWHYHDPDEPCRWSDDLC